MDHDEDLTTRGPNWDGVDDDAEPATDLLGPEFIENRYAIPLGTLLAGTFVAQADQVVIHPLPRHDDVGAVVTPAIYASSGD